MLVALVEIQKNYRLIRWNPGQLAIDRRIGWNPGQIDMLIGWNPEQLDMLIGWNPRHLWRLNGWNHRQLDRHCYFLSWICQSFHCKFTFWCKYHWLGSDKACPLTYSHFAISSWFIENEKRYIFACFVLFLYVVFYVMVIFIFARPKF